MTTGGIERKELLKRMARRMASVDGVRDPEMLAVDARAVPLRLGRAQAFLAPHSPVWMHYLDLAEEALRCVEEARR